ncbi:MAG: hypothetical protein ISR48_04060 [Alphaproteobacteria bacterium]|nr:hypothetical protein [Alphaproteobacteria bacterium]
MPEKATPRAKTKAAKAKAAKTREKQARLAGVLRENLRRRKTRKHGKNNGADKRTKAR